MVELSTSDDPIAAFRFGDSAAQQAKAAAIDHDGNLLIAGDFQGMLGLGVGYTVVSQDVQSVSLARGPR